VADFECCSDDQALDAALGGVRGDPTHELQRIVAAAAAAAVLLLLVLSCAAAVVARPCSSKSDGNHKRKSDVNQQSIKKGSSQVH
jgi:hypothetical protein